MKNGDVKVEPMAPGVTQKIETAEVKLNKAAQEERDAIAKIEIDENLFQKYMVQIEENLTDDDRATYVKGRYENIQRDSKALALQRWEAEKQKREDLLAEITKLYRFNYKARIWAVRTLRVLGVPTTDELVP